VKFSTTPQLGYILFLKIFWWSTHVCGQCRTLTKLIDAINSFEMPSHPHGIVFNKYYCVVKTKLKTTCSQKTSWLKNTFFLLVYRRYNLAMFTHAMEFFKECASLKKPILEHFFTSLLNNLPIKDLLTLGNLLSTKFMNPRWLLYATPCRWAWVPQKLKNKVLKQSVNCWMIGLTLKLQDVYHSRKKWGIKNWMGNQNPIFTLNLAQQTCEDEYLLKVWDYRRKYLFMKFKKNLWLNLSNLE
jgi:hypothetical protein